MIRVHVSGNALDGTGTPKSWGFLNFLANFFYAWNYDDTPFYFMSQACCPCVAMVNQMIKHSNKTNKQSFHNPKTNKEKHSKHQPPYWQMISNGLTNRPTSQSIGWSINHSHSKVYESRPPYSATFSHIQPYSAAFWFSSSNLQTCLPQNNLLSMNDPWPGERG